MKAFIWRLFTAWLMLPRALWFVFGLGLGYFRFDPRSMLTILLLAMATDISWRFIFWGIRKTIDEMKARLKNV